LVARKMHRCCEVRRESWTVNVEEERERGRWMVVP
jgi:hypothetical protein